MAAHCAAEQSDKTVGSDREGITKTESKRPEARISSALAHVLTASATFPDRVSAAEPIGPVGNFRVRRTKIHFLLEPRSGVTSISYRVLPAKKNWNPSVPTRHSPLLFVLPSTRPLLRQETLLSMASLKVPIRNGTSNYSTKAVILVSDIENGIQLLLTSLSGRWPISRHPLPSPKSRSPQGKSARRQSQRFLKAHSIGSLYSM